MREQEFRYVYSAPTERERREIESIRAAYLPDAERRSKTEQLRRLDARARRLPTAAALTTGIAGLLAFGGGMALTLELGQPVWGIVLSLLGAAVAAAAYPLHKLLLRRARKKYGARILVLCDELLPEAKEKDRGQ